ncbi:MAG TPA: LON peptidase substrate-binding domain-containing protein [Phycisphaerales bacterium]|nr:LON peptidase substrate-binding domain-containing protein [Phycisphaerales bacterium]HMP37256.1 LON peptidase substrate-binding domain-containing protein [Phycisphaerales bacterium]
MDESITVDFREPMPVLALPGFVMLPHAVQPLHIFEPRYRQVVARCMEAEDGPVHIAMATYAGERELAVGAKRGRLRPAVCVGQIVRGATLPDGRSNILVHGVCRGRIVEVLEPRGERLYHEAMVVPIERDPSAVPAMPGLRERLRELIAGPQLSRMNTARAIVEWLDRDDVPTHALLEIVGFALVRDEKLRYRLLEEPTPQGRARLVRAELTRLVRLVAKADEQNWRDWPKGLSWN